MIPSRLLSRSELAQKIAEVALLRGDFTLRSGRKSSYYLDKYRFETQPDVLLALGQMFAERIRPNVNVIAGAELGAVPLAAMASIFSGKPCVFIRNQKKDYGTAKLVEGELRAGQTVTIVEDVLTTGGQVLESCKVLTELGVSIDAVVGVIDRMEGAREDIEAQGFRFEALFTIADLGISRG